MNLSHARLPPLLQREMVVVRQHVEGNVPSTEEKIPQQTQSEESKRDAIRSALDSVFPHEFLSCSDSSLSFSDGDRNTVSNPNNAINETEDPSLSLTSVRRMQASLCPVSPIDALHLHQELERRCSLLSVRPGLRSLSADRNMVHRDVWDELVRQCIIQCPERGLMIHDVRCELQQSIESYETMFQDASLLARRKGLEVSQLEKLREERMRIQSEVQTAENRVREMRSKLFGIEQRCQERRDALDKTHKEDVLFLKKANQQLTAEIKRVTS